MELALLAILIIIAIVSNAVRRRNSGYDDYRAYGDRDEYVPPEKIVGCQGEYIATNEICMVLRENDYLFTHIIGPAFNA